MKDTELFGLKLYDGTDAPDLIAGYNASMEVLEDARIMHRGGTLRLLEADFNDLTATAYYNNNGYAFTADNHGPVGSHEFGILVVYDYCEHAGRLICTVQHYFPFKDGTGDAYRPMMRTLADGRWSAWAPLVGGTLPANGAAGQVLVKSSASNYDCEWMDPTALNTIREIKTGPDLTAWLKASPSTGEWWSGPGEVKITVNASTEQYTGNWTVYRTPTSIGNAYFQGSGGRAATARFASLKTDRNANWWAFVMSIKDTEPTFQYVEAITPQLTAMLKRVTTF